MGIKTRKCLDQINTYITAKSIESVKREFGLDRIIKLAANENTIGYSPKVREAIEGQFDSLSYYPDINVTALKEKLAAFHQVETEELIFGNGSFELISIVAQTFLEPGDESITIHPSFGWYNSVTLQMGGEVVTVPLVNFETDLDLVKSKITNRTKIIWLCNPNNPVGTFLKEDVLHQFLKEVRDDIVVVLDEAYVDFVVEDGFPNSILWINEFPNIIILRTFSKAYGLASFRIGYGVASKEFISYLQKVRLPINTNAAAQIAALAALEDQEFKNAIVENNKVSLEKYYQTLDELGLSYVVSNCNFILFDSGVDSEWLAFEFLKKGIMIRAGVEFGLPTWVRISIGTPEENEIALTQLKVILSEKKQLSVAIH